VSALARYVDDFLAMTAPLKSMDLTVSRANESRSHICSLAKELGVALDKFQLGTP